MDFCQNKWGLDWVALHWTIDIAANIATLYDSLFCVLVFGGTMSLLISNVCKVDGRGAMVHCPTLIPLDSIDSRPKIKLILLPVSTRP